MLLYGITRLAERKSRQKRFYITLSARGAELRFEFAVTLLREDVREIREGEVVLVGRYRKPPITIPGKAFADPEAAKQFADAARVLWRSRGD